MGFDLNTQHWGDSFKLMPRVPDDWVDMVLYSPPYIAGKGYEDETSSGIEAYKDASDRMFAEVARVLKPAGAFGLEVGFFKQGKNAIRPMMYELWRIAEKHGLHVVQEFIWHFRGGLTGSPRQRRAFNRHEYLVILSPDPANIYFSKEEVRDLGDNVSYSKRNNKFGAAPASVWSDEPTANARLREIAMSIAQGRITEAEARLAATETLANFLVPGISGAVDELMHWATKLKPDDPPVADRCGHPLLNTNKVIGNTFWNNETSWLIERVTIGDKYKYHECPIPPLLVDNAVRQFCPPGG
ncbi:MAG: DNA methyltransferase, partial [Acidimicrobiia bacterium]